jgi:hypothetical protein
MSSRGILVLFLSLISLNLYANPKKMTCTVGVIQDGKDPEVLARFNTQVDRNANLRGPFEYQEVKYELLIHVKTGNLNELSIKEVETGAQSIASFLETEQSGIVMHRRPNESFYSFSICQFNKTNTEALLKLKKRMVRLNLKNN